MKRILLQLDGDRHASTFDAIAAFDAGVDEILPYSAIAPGEVRNLVYGAMFTRGGDALKNSAVFIGGSDVPLGESLLKAAQEAFFGPVRVSVMFDANGCNTTAAAAVRKIASTGSLAGKKVVVLAGTGPVGLRAAAMLGQEAAEVTLTSRSLERAQKATASIAERFGVQAHPALVANVEETGTVLEGAHAALCCGAAGAVLLPSSVWMDHPTLRVLADVNAVPPPGIEGIKPSWDGREECGKVIFGALAIGGLKMKIHRASVAQLFAKNDQVLDAEAVYALARELAA